MPMRVNTIRQMGMIQPFTLLELAESARRLVEDFLLTNRRDYDSPGGTQLTERRPPEEPPAPTHQRTISPD